MKALSLSQEGSSWFAAKRGTSRKPKTWAKIGRLSPHPENEPVGRRGDLAAVSLHG